MHLHTIILPIGRIHHFALSHIHEPPAMGLQVDGTVGRLHLHHSNAMVRTQDGTTHLRMDPPRDAPAAQQSHRIYHQDYLLPLLPQLLQEHEPALLYGHNHCRQPSRQLLMRHHQHLEPHQRTFSRHRSHYRMHLRLLHHLPLQPNMVAMRKHTALGRSHEQPHATARPYP